MFVVKCQNRGGDVRIICRVNSRDAALEQCNLLNQNPWNTAWFEPCEMVGAK